MNLNADILADFHGIRVVGMMVIELLFVNLINDGILNISANVWV